MPGVVIAGAGHAGGRAALQIRARGYDGPVTLIGREPDAPYERPPLSKGILLGTKESEECQLVPLSRWQELNISLRLDESIIGIDPQANTAETANGSSLHYDKLVIATGGNCRKLNAPGSELKHIFELREIADSIRIRDRLQENARLVVVGGGFIGLELAAAGIQRGCRVTVVEVADQLLTRAFPAPVSRKVQEIHVNRGVEFIFSDSVSRFEGSDKVTSVLLASGRTLPADLVVVGIGLVPETRIASRAGLDVEDGILANEFCQASKADVYAIGDCAKAYNLHYHQHMRLESWQNAEQQADVVARHICGDPGGWQAVPWFWTDQYEFNIQMAGNPLDGTEHVSRGALSDGAKLYFTGDHGVLTGAVAIGKGTAAARDLRISQMLIQNRQKVELAQLADPEFRLKGLLKN